MTEYYVDVPDDLAQQLKSVDDDRIISALEEVAEAHTSDEDEEELAQYGSVRDIRADDTLSEAERKRRIIRAKRKGLRR
jgi:hypothetical protein